MSSSLKVVTENLTSNPSCPHGPTLLFIKGSGENQKRFFGCSACRDRKLCTFFLKECDKAKLTDDKVKMWQNERLRLIKGINHKKMFLTLNKIKNLPKDQRSFCNTCSKLMANNESKLHSNHSIITPIEESQLEHPSDFLPPLENAKKEAQYLFSKESVSFLVNVFLDFKYKNVICIGTPRIHEFIRSSVGNLSSILLDFDSRFHNFFSPLEFCWYNMFNNHFFFDEAKEVFKDFLINTKGKDTVLITDPPFGGRTEPLIQTLTTLNAQYKMLNKSKDDLDIFWIFPYFMEPQIVHSMPAMQMLDYKVQYDNHPLFHNGTKGRKQGSPVRIFTNVTTRKIKLPEGDYKFCKQCKKWVAKENRHCKICQMCTSKNGETYVHCNTCRRCVKPNWRHCEICQRCIQLNHVCEKTLNLKIVSNSEKLGLKKKVLWKEANFKRKRTKNISLKNKKVKI